MPECFICGAPVIWGNDFSMEDYGMDEDGIVSNWSCSECGAYYEVYQSFEEDKRDCVERDEDAGAARD